MYSEEIEQELSGVKFFKGVFPCDKLKFSKSLPAYYVINTDRANKKGEHWQALIINKDKSAYFFDSFGMPPLEKPILNILAKNVSRWMYNSATLQHPTARTCGNYCIEFIKSIDRGEDYMDFLSYFTRCLKCNEVKISYKNKSLKKTNSVAKNHLTSEHRDGDEPKTS